MRKLSGMFVILALTYIFSPVVQATTPDNVTNVQARAFQGEVYTRTGSSVVVTYKYIANLTVGTCNSYVETFVGPTKARTVEYPGTGTTSTSVTYGTCVQVFVPLADNIL